MFERRIYDVISNNIDEDFCYCKIDDIDDLFWKV